MSTDVIPAEGDVAGAIAALKGMLSDAADGVIESIPKRKPPAEAESARSPALKERVAYEIARETLRSRQNEMLPNLAVALINAKCPTETYQQIIADADWPDLSRRIYRSLMVDPLMPAAEQALATKAAMGDTRAYEALRKFEPEPDTKETRALMRALEDPVALERKVSDMIKELNEIRDLARPPQAPEAVVASAIKEIAAAEQKPRSKAFKKKPIAEQDDDNPLTA